MSAETDENPYVLSPDWEPERRRLGLLEQVYDPGAQARLSSLGLAAGSRCLEIGAGGGSMTQWMCHEVGPDGRVTAIDLDTRWISQLDEPNLTVLNHNLLTDDFPPGSFDFIYARAVFEHIADRGSAVPRVCEWLAPGGWLYLENFASFPLPSSPHPAYAAGMQAFIELIGRTGTSYEWARTFPQPLIDAGLGEIGASVNVHAMQGGSPVAEFFSMTLAALSARIVEAGVATQSVLDAAQATLADPAIWDLAPALVGAWGRKKA